MDISERVELALEGIEMMSEQEAIAWLEKLSDEERLWRIKKLIWELSKSNAE
jgi:hypothetical protein